MGNRRLVLWTVFSRFIRYVFQANLNRAFQFRDGWHAFFFKRKLPPYGLRVVSNAQPWLCTGKVSIALLLHHHLSYPYPVSCEMFEIRIRVFFFWQPLQRVHFMFQFSVATGGPLWWEWLIYSGWVPRFRVHRLNELRPGAAHKSSRLHFYSNLPWAAQRKSNLMRKFACHMTDLLHVSPAIFCVGFGTFDMYRDRSVKFSLRWRSLHRKLIVVWPVPHQNVLLVARYVTLLCRTDWKKTRCDADTEPSAILSTPKGWLFFD